MIELLNDGVMECWLEMAAMAGNDWKWLEMTGNGWNVWKLLEMS